MHKCPICKGSLNELNGVVLYRNTVTTDKGSVSLGFVGIGIVDALLQHPLGATMSELIQIVYGAGGGPLTVKHSIAVALTRLRRQLLEIGLNIRNVGSQGKPGGFYILEQIELEQLQ